MENPKFVEIVDDATLDNEMNYFEVTKERAGLDKEEARIKILTDLEINELFEDIVVEK